MNRNATMSTQVGLAVLAVLSSLMLGACTSGGSDATSTSAAPGLGASAPAAAGQQQGAQAPGSIAIGTDISAVEQAGGGSAGAPPPSGQETWAVVLAGASLPDDVLLSLALSDAAEAGYKTTGATNCDQGAAEALGMSPDGTYTVSVYFPSEREAAEARSDLEGRGVPGVVAELVQYCPE